MSVVPGVSNTPRGRVCISDSVVVTFCSVRGDKPESPTTLGSGPPGAAVGRDEPSSGAPAWKSRPLGAFMSCSS